MTNVTISPFCGSLGFETEPPLARVVRRVWEWIVCDVEKLFYEEELILAYESQGPPPSVIEINCKYTDSGSSRCLSFFVYRS